MLRQLNVSRDEFDARYGKNEQPGLIVRRSWRRFAELGIEVVVDVYDGRVVTVWRQGVRLDGLPFRADVARVMQSVAFRILEGAR